MSVVEQESISAGHSWAAFYRRLHAAQHRGAAASRVSAGSVPGQSWRADPIAPERRARDLADREHPGTLTLSDLAAAAGLSRHHLVRRFAASYGQTPMRYLAARRLERASDLLRTTELPVLEICLAVGYRSLGSFGRAFLARFGMAPADYRRRMRDPARVPGCFAFMTGAVRDRATSE
jgi:AraC-like DNA-binding protein